MATPDPDLPLDYRPADRARFDELVDAAGRYRAHWRALLPALAELGADGLQQSQLEARRLMRANGVIHNTFRAPGEDARNWQLDPIPLVIAADEWTALEQGLRQRAELFRRLLGDLYGPQRLLGRLLPPALLFADPAYLRSCHGLGADDSRRLTLYAADLARGPDGGHYVVADRTQAPPGAGLALENRMILSRVLAGLFRDTGVRRMATYFRTLRATLMRLAWQQREDTRIALMTPGPDHEAHFEHVFLANYLGYTLVEGADLSVREGVLYLKTLDGLRRIDVLLRSIDDRDCDPLELRPDSLCGVAGLLASIRRRQVALANPPGVGVLENPALARYLPALARELLGEELLLPSPPCFWCGIDAERAHVLQQLPRLRILRRAGGGIEAVNGARLGGDELRRLASLIRAQPEQYAAQEIIAASTAPTLSAAGLQPRPLLLRCFLVANPKGYLALPGGLARVAAAADEAVPAVLDGGVSKDVWVLSGANRAPRPPGGAAQTRFAIRDGELPSRAAENLYWFGRYAERSESIARLLREVFCYLLEPDEDYGAISSEACLNRLLRAVTELTDTQPGFIGRGGRRRLAAPDRELLSVLLDPTRGGSLAATLRALLASAGAVRDRLSPDLWRVLGEVDENLALQRRPSGRALLTLPAARSGSIQPLNAALGELERLLASFSALAGLAADNMTQGQGWRLLTLGRRLERARQTASLLRITLTGGGADEPVLLEYLLRVGDSLMTYRRRYRSQLQSVPVLELMLQDETNPRAVGYQLEQLHRFALALPGVSPALPYQKDVQSLALAALNAVRLAQPERLLAERGRGLDALLGGLGARLPALSDALSHSYFSHAETARQLGSAQSL